MKFILLLIFIFLAYHTIRYFVITKRPHERMLSIKTTRYAALIKRIFLAYNDNVEIYIDGGRYTEKDIPNLLEWWCYNKTIKATLDFTLKQNGVAIFGFHDTPDEFWAAMSERVFIEQLAKEKIVRLKKYI